jgi:hypothetical protein
MANRDAAADVGTLGIVIGTAKDWRVTLTSRATGAALPLTAVDKIVFTASRNGAPYFTRRNTAAGGGDSEIAIVDGPSGVIDIKAVEANTSGLAATAELVVECRYELASDSKDRCAFVGKLSCRKTDGVAIP